MKIIRTRVHALASGGLVLASGVLLAAPALVALALPADEVAFHPKADAALAKKLEVELELQLEDLTFEVNGEDQSDNMGAVAGEPMLVHLLVGVTDKYVQTKDGRPTDLRRTFDDLELSGEFGDEKKDSEEFAEMEGRTVRFQWNEESQEYERSFHESAGDDKDLENLLEDMDLRAFLPGKKVSEGDVWEVAGKDVASLFLPGGVPKGAGDDKDDENLALVMDELEGEIEKFLKEFKVACKYQGSRDESGTRVGVIELKFDGRADIDLSGPLQRLAEQNESDVSVEVQAKAGFELKGEGEILWDLAAGHVHALSMQSDVSLTTDIHASANAQGQDIEMSAGGRLAGKATWSLATTKP